MTIIELQTKRSQLMECLSKSVDADKELVPGLSASSEHAEIALTFLEGALNRARMLCSIAPVAPITGLVGAMAMTEIGRTMLKVVEKELERRQQPSNN